MSYGVEIWGWEEREKMERMEERYLKWVLGVDRRTPGYLMKEELQRDKLRGRAGRRPWGYKRRFEEGRGSELARSCWREIKKRAKEEKGILEWEKGRKKFFENRGLSVKEMERRRKGELEYKELENRDRRRQEEERGGRIKNSRFSRWYGRVKGKGIPAYLKKRWRRVGGGEWRGLGWETR